MKSLIKSSRRCEEVASILKVLSHPLRLKILALLINKEQAVGELAKICGCSQSQMSQFLGRMRLENLVKSRKQGHSVFYEIHDSDLKTLISTIITIYCH